MKISINNFSGGVDGNLSENLCALGKSQMCYNFDFSGGALKSGVGFKPQFALNLAGEEVLDSLLIGKEGVQGGCVFLYRRYDQDAQKEDDKLIIFDENYKGYYINLYEKEPALVELGVKFSSRPEAVNYRLMGEDVIIMVSEGDNMVVWNGVSAPEVIIDAPLITSMVIHYERLFATTIGDQLSLKFSDDLDPTNWSESLDDAGFIQMIDERGKLKKVLSFNDYLYVFREKGITRVYANTADQTNFYVNHLFTAGGDILHKTIALCGDKILFVASDGIYFFDGSSAYRRLDNLFPLIKVTSKSVAEYHAGKYYLACNVDFGDHEYSDENSDFNNAIVEIDVETLSYKIIRGLEVIDLLSYSANGESGLLVLAANDKKPLKMLKYVNGASEVAASGAETQVVSKFKAGLTSLSVSKERKVARKVGVLAYGGTQIKLFNESGESVEVDVSDGGYNEYPIFFPFELLGLEIKTTALGAKVEKLEITFY